MPISALSLAFFDPHQRPSSISAEAIFFLEGPVPGRRCHRARPACAGRSGPGSRRPWPRSRPALADLATFSSRFALAWPESSASGSVSWALARIASTVSALGPSAPCHCSPVCCFPPLMTMPADGRLRASSMAIAFSQFWYSCAEAPIGAPLPVGADPALLLSWRRHQLRGSTLVLGLALGSGSPEGVGDHALRSPGAA